MVRLGASKSAWIISSRFFPKRLDNARPLWHTTHWYAPEPLPNKHTSLETSALTSAPLPSRIVCWINRSSRMQTVPSTRAVQASAAVSAARIRLLSGTGQRTPAS